MIAFDVNFFDHECTHWPYCVPESFMRVVENPELLNDADRNSSNWSPHNHDPGDEA